MRNIFILFTLTCLISNAQRIKRVILIDVTSKEPIPLFSVKLNNDSIVYTNLNGKLLVNSSNTLYFDNEIYESLTLKANDISDTIFLHPKNHLLEELVINKQSVDKEILPFYKNNFTDKKDLIETFPIATNHEFISKITFDPINKNTLIKNILFKIIIENDLKGSNAYYRLNIYDSSRNIIYKSTPISTNKKRNIINHKLTRYIYTDEEAMYFGLEVIGIVDTHGNFKYIDKYYTRLSLFNTKMKEYICDNYIRTITKDKLYKINSPNKYKDLNFFGFILN